MSSLKYFKIENLNDMFHLKDNIEGIELTCFAVCTHSNEGTNHYHIEALKVRYSLTLTSML